MTHEQAVNQGSLRLAFIGDAVHSLYIREQILLHHKDKVPVLNTLVADKVNAAAQSRAYDKLLSFLTEDELEIMKRGKNAHVGHIPKNQTIEDYHKATAFEALLGYLYLTDNATRLNEILSFTEEK